MCAWSFGDSFDLYNSATAADAVNGYWDSGTTGNLAITMPGRFAVGQIIAATANVVVLTKASNVNDAVHHLIVAFLQNPAAITGSTLGTYLQLLDGTTGQCAVVFRSDGAIVLTSGTPAGTTLATYTGAFTAINTWYAFEFEIIINNTTGRFRVRKNGNTSDDFDSGAVLNTRGGTANNYANKLSVGRNATVTSQYFDDLFWRSDASSVAWMGDLRCYTRMPASDASVQFSKSPTTMLMQGNATVTTGALTANNVRATLVVASSTGTVASLSANFNAGITGHAKMAVYDATGSGGGAGTLLFSSAELTNPGAGVNTFTVTGSPVITRGTTYWVALWSDVSITGTGTSGTSFTCIVPLTYTTSFPGTMTGFTQSPATGLGSNGMNVTPLNAGCVNEAQQDATASYVYDSTVGHADFYNIGSIASTPSTIVAVTTRGYMQKSDAGSRTAAVQLKSVSTTVASPTLTLSTSGWQWTWRTDLTDPATSAAWTAAGVNAATIGPTVIS